MEWVTNVEKVRIGRVDYIRSADVEKHFRISAKTVLKKLQKANASWYYVNADTRHLFLTEAGVYWIAMGLTSKAARALKAKACALLCTIEKIENPVQNKKLRLLRKRYPGVTFSLSKNGALYRRTKKIKLCSKTACINKRKRKHETCEWHDTDARNILLKDNEVNCLVRKHVEGKLYTV